MKFAIVALFALLLLCIGAAVVYLRAAEPAPQHDGRGTRLIVCPADLANA